MVAFDKNTNYFGLDIGTTGVRIVQLQQGSDAPGLVTYGDTLMPADLSGSDFGADQDKLADIIRRLKNETGTTANQVVTALPSSEAFTTVITTPKLNQNELQKFIHQRVDEYIPMPAKDVRLDWHTVDSNKSENEMAVLLVAAPKNTVNKYISIIEKAGLNLMALEINALAVARSVVSRADVPVVVIDWGSANAEITIIWQRIPHAVKNVNIGGETLVHSVEQNLNVDTEQAQQFMQKFGMAETKLEGQVRKAMQKPIDSVMEEASALIEQFTSQNESAQLEKAILTGGPTALPELPAYAANSLNLPVEIANPWVNVSYSANQHGALMDNSLHFAVAVGLAQRAFV